MTDRGKAYIAIWLSFLACAFAVANMKEDSFRSTASRLDLKVMTLEIKGPSALIPRMGKLRNETRAKAEQMEAAVVLLAIGLAVAAPAMIASMAGAWVLLSVSGIAATSAGYFAVMAI